MRELRFVPDYTMHAEGSVLAEFGNTRVLCTASIEERVPPWMRNSGRDAAARHTHAFGS
jgi:ribonuclease PH